MRNSALLLLMAGVCLVGAEYEWTGTEWKWVEAPRGGGAPAAADPFDEEGSGGGGGADDEDYNYDSDYPDESLLTPVKNNPGLPTDDEDMVEGSGDDSDIYDQGLPRGGGGGSQGGGWDDAGSVDPWAPEEEKDEGSGDYYGGGGGGVSTPGFDRPSSGGFDNTDPFLPNTNNKNVDEKKPASTTTTTTTESSFIDLDSYNGYDEYTDPYDEKFDNNDDFYPDIYDKDSSPPVDAALPPISNVNDHNNNGDDDFGFEDTRSSPKTTTTTSTSKPYVPSATDRSPQPDTPVVSDVPTNRPGSFFAQPGILAAIIGGAVVGLLCAILLVMFIVYRYVVVFYSPSVGMSAYPIRAHTDLGRLLNNIYTYDFFTTKTSETRTRIFKR